MTSNIPDVIGGRDPRLIELEKLNRGEPVIPDWQSLTVYGFNGRRSTVSYGFAVDQGWVPAGLSVTRYIDGGYENGVLGSYYQFTQGLANQGSGRGRGRSGAAAPTYQAPDTATVRETMKAYVVATTGKANQKLIDAAVNEYLKKDKARFQAVDSPQDIDPMLAAQGTVRNSIEYQRIHQQRPDSVDEMEWVTQRQSVLRNAGLNANTAEDLGIVGARGAATTESLVGAAEIAQVADTGRLLQQQREKLKSKAAVAMRLL